MIINIPVLLKVIYPLHYRETIMKYSREYRLDPYTVAAVIRTESSFNPFAESGKGARGLMQITPATGKWIAGKLEIKNYTDDSLFDPVINIRLGCWYINHLYDYYGGSSELVFAAYNGGQGNVDKWLKDKSFSQNGRTLDVIPFPETKKFVERINRNRSIYMKLYNLE